MREIKNKNVQMKYVELLHGDSIENLLHDLYIEQELSIRDVAKKLDIHYHTVNKWLKMAGLEMRLPYEKMLEIVEIKRKLKNGGK